MPKLLVSSEQRFTCAQCGRCCHRTTVPVTKAEVEALRAAGVGKWLDEDPFEPIPGHGGLLRIRKRADGACVFLTPESRCRIHEAMGERSKPLACRVFPFSFHPFRGAGASGQNDDEIVVSASFACPTVIANQGAPVSGYQRDVSRLYADWARVFPEAARPVEFVRGHAISRDALARVRTFLTLLLDRSPDIRANLRRIAKLLEDWSRPKVLQLPPEALVEYFELTGNYALGQEGPASQRRASRVARLLFRGFLFAVLSLQLRLDAGDGRSRARLRLTLARLMAHLHGAGPSVGLFNLRRAKKLPIGLDDPSVHAIVHRHLQAGFESIGSTRRPVIDEVAMRVAYLTAACVVGAMYAAGAGKTVVDGESLTKGLLAAGDLSQTDAGGRLSDLLTTLSGGLEALYLFPALQPV